MTHALGPLTRETSPSPSRPPPAGPMLEASPNPVPSGFGRGTTEIRWDSGDETSAEIRVAAGHGEEAIFARGSAGSQSAAFILAGETYQFRLYSGPDRSELLVSTTVTREAMPIEALVNELMLHVRAETALPRAARALAPILGRLLHGGRYRDCFLILEESGCHLTPGHFYSPIPDTKVIGVDRTQSQLVGVDMNERAQGALLKRFSRFSPEYNKFPRKPTKSSQDFYFDNGSFSGMDALLLYCMIRHFRPKLIIEVGAGFSTRVVVQAAKVNGGTEVVCVEPYPTHPERHQGLSELSGIASLIVKPVQEVDLSVFERLEKDDILFIDSSHVARTRSDVVFLLLEVLPRSKPGVLVHIHDIFFPRDYPKAYIVNELKFFNEQYLLQAFLAFNSEFEVVFANSYMASRVPDLLWKVFPRAPWLGGASLWIRRKAVRPGKRRS